MITVVTFHITVALLFSNGEKKNPNKKNMLTDELYKCVQSIPISG